MALFKKGQVWRLMDKKEGFIDLIDIIEADEKTYTFEWRGLDGSNVEGDTSINDGLPPRSGDRWWELAETEAFNSIIDKYYESTADQKTD